MTLEDLAARIRVALPRGQVALGLDRFFSLNKRKQVALVWILNDLSRKATNKLLIECMAQGVPILQGGDLEAIGELTGQPTVKVYLLKKGFPGLPVVMRDLRAAGLLNGSGPTEAATEPGSDDAES